MAKVYTPLTSSNHSGVDAERGEGGLGVRTPPFGALKNFIEREKTCACTQIHPQSSIKCGNNVIFMS